MTQVWFARWLSLSVGFLSLSQEILLVRLVGFVYHSTPKAFSFVLVFFLLGIAAGAYAGKRLCASRANLIGGLAVALLCAGAFDAAVPFILVPAIATGIDFLPPLIIFAAAALKGIAFPVAHLLGSGGDSKKMGSSVSKVYFFNIAGSTLGPLLTGFVVLQYVDLAHSMLLIALGTMALGLWCAAREWPRPSIALAAVAALAMTPLLLSTPTLIQDIVALDAVPSSKVVQVIENRNGIIHVTRDPSVGGDSTYGGNLYDGRINTDLRINSNGVNRLYVLSALRPSPQRVLLIGLSSGAWTAILSKMPGVEHIDAVEVNPGYVDVIRRYPEVSGILEDPKITIFFDDGRRWLRRNADSRYDLIVMNTSWHWRAYSTNLLSIEFLREAKRHLRPGGLITWNGTYSPDVLQTASKVFAYVRKYDSFAYAADYDFIADFDKNKDRIWSYGMPQAPMFDRLAAADQTAIDKMYKVPFETLADVQAKAGRPLEVITDDNLLTEFKYGRAQYFLRGF